MNARRIDALVPLFCVVEDGQIFPVVFVYIQKLAAHELIYFYVHDKVFVSEGLLKVLCIFKWRSITIPYIHVQCSLGQTPSYRPLLSNENLLSHRPYTRVREGGIKRTTERKRLTAFYISIYVIGHLYPANWFVDILIMHHMLGMLLYLIRKMQESECWQMLAGPLISGRKMIQSTFAGMSSRPCF